MSIDPVRIQVGIRLSKDAPVTYDFLRGVIAHWVDGGTLPRGIKITYVRWINPVRATRGLAAWKDSRDKDQSLQGARATLRGLLRSVHLNIEIRGGSQPAPVKIKKRPTKKKKKPAQKQKKRKLQRVRKDKGVRK